MPSRTPMITSRRGGHIPFIQAGAETPDTAAEAVKPDPSSVSGMKIRSLVGCPPTRHSIGDQPSASHVCMYGVVVRRTDEMLCGGYRRVSQFEAPCICSRWTGER